MGTSLALTAALLGSSACVGEVSHHAGPSLSPSPEPSPTLAYTKLDVQKAVTRALQHPPSHDHCSAPHALGEGAVLPNLKRLFPQMGGQSDIQEEATAQSAILLLTHQAQPNTIILACAEDLVSPTGIPEGSATLAYLADTE